MRVKIKKCLSIIVMTVAVVFMLSKTVFASGNATTVSTVDEFKNAVADDTVTTITLSASMDLSDEGVLNVTGKTIDLGGNTISASNFTLLFEGSNFVLKNGTFDSKGGSYALFIGDEGTTDNVTVEGITMNGGVNVFNATNVTLKDVNVTGTNYYAVWCDENGHVTIESGSFQTNGDAVVGLTMNESELIIQGGQFVTNGKPLVLKDGEKFGKPQIIGGSFDIDEIGDYCGDMEIVEDGKGGYTVCIHDDIELQNQKDASCTEEGYTGDKLCKKCRKLLEQGKSIPMKEHSYKEGKCTVCGVIDSSYNKTDDTEKPTKNDLIQSALTKNNSMKSVVPKTGDGNGIIPAWISCMGVSAIVASVVLYRKKKYFK